MTVELYTKPSCGYCIQAKNLLNSKGIQFKEYTLGANVTKEDIEKRIRSLGLNVQVRTVPQIFYTDKSGKTTYIGGYTDLLAKQSILNT